MPSPIRGYHIHVYFNKASASEQTALELREKAKEYWGERAVGRFHRDPIGPHTTGSFQIWIYKGQRDEAIEWTTANRNGLKAMMHKVTGDSMEAHFHDHTEAVTWYGEGAPQILDTSIFKSEPKPT